MKVQRKRAFKSYSFFTNILTPTLAPPPKKKKAERLCIKFSSTPNTSVQQLTQFHNFNCKINARLTLLPLFFKACLNPQVRFNKTVNEHCVNYHQGPSGLSSVMNPPKFLETP